MFCHSRWINRISLSGYILTLGFGLLKMFVVEVCWMYLNKGVSNWAGLPWSRLENGWWLHWQHHCFLYRTMCWSWIYDHAQITELGEKYGPRAWIRYQRPHCCCLGELPQFGGDGSAANILPADLCDKYLERLPRQRNLFSHSPKQGWTARWQDQGSCFIALTTHIIFT